MIKHGLMRFLDVLIEMPIDKNPLTGTIKVTDESSEETYLLSVPADTVEETLDSEISITDLEQYISNKYGFHNYLMVTSASDMPVSGLFVLYDLVYIRPGTTPTRRIIYRNENDSWSTGNTLSYNYPAGYHIKVMNIGDY